MASQMAADTTTISRGPLVLAHTHYMGLSGKALRVAIAATAGLCFIVFGYGQGDIGGLMVMESFLTRFPELQGQSLHAGQMQGITVGIWNLGCFVGAAFTIYLGNLLGRKWTIAVGLVVMLIGKIVQVSTFSFGQYLAGRIIAGLGNG
jgi:MFS family permease